MKDSSKEDYKWKKPEIKKITANNPMIKINKINNKYNKKWILKVNRTNS